jgi:transcriptional regulator with XRE-family HTH domain
MSRGRIALDQESFAVDCASGLYTQEELASRHGVSKSLVNKIVSGQRRPEVRDMIDSARQEACQWAEERLTRLIRGAVGVLEAGLMGEGTHVAIRAACEILNRTIGRPALGTGLRRAPAELA